MINNAYTPYECIRLSQKFEQSELDHIFTRVWGQRFNKKITWYTGNVPYKNLLLDFPLLDVKILFFELLKYKGTSLKCNIDYEYILEFKQNIYKAYNLKDLLYKVCMTELPNKSTPILK